MTPKYFRVKSVTPTFLSLPTHPPPLLQPVAFVATAPTFVVPHTHTRHTWCAFPAVDDDDDKNNYYYYYNNNNNHSHNSFWIMRLDLTLSARSRSRARRCERIRSHLPSTCRLSGRRPSRHLCMCRTHTTHTLPSPPPPLTFPSSLWAVQHLHQQQPP